MKSFVEILTENVADRILDLLGGNKFKTMTVAKTYSDKKTDALVVNFKGSRIANYLKVTLEHYDTYHMEFGKLTGVQYKIVEEFTRIPASELQKKFTDVTGLDTHL